MAGSLGVSLAAVAVHYTIWPWRLRCGCPVLTEAEGLERRYLPAYNAMLLTWALLAVESSVREVPPGSRRWIVTGLAAAMPLRRHARRHFAWVAEQSRVHPSWWNRALRAPVFDGRTAG